jgi:hypothetical protein
MIRATLKCGAILGLLLGGVGAAYADDPTGVLEQERGTLPHANGPLAKFSDVGPCQRGMVQEAFPNGQGFRCVRRH